VRSNGGDPHRVLGIARDATEAEIKRAYRALAKRHHPDAGQGSVARFLEIQAAYEALVGGGSAPGGADPSASRPARAPRRPAQPGGPRGADRGAGPTGAPDSGPPGSSTRGPSPGTEWARRPRGGSARRPDAGPGGAPGTPGTPGAPGAFGASGSPRPGETGDRPRQDHGPRGRRSAGRRRATLGSTSYDGAEEVFEPDWRGATWYGPSSGTYWTLNPKEYADPRKHGPEYQARARRRAGAGADGATGMDSGHPGAPASMDAPPAGATGGADTAAGDGLPPSWRAGTWTATAASAADRVTFEHEPESAPPPAGPEASPGEPSRSPAGASSPRPSAEARAPAGTAVPRARAGAQAPRPAPSAPTLARAGDVGPGVVTRVILAVLGWLVPGLAVAAVAGLPGGLVATLPLQAAGVAVLAVVPRAAWASIGGGLALVLAAIPIVAVVAALGGPFVPGAPAPEAAVVLAALAWASGAFLVGAGRIAPYPWPGHA
jgi:hypothetical protein